MARHGSKDVVFLVDGYNILGARPQSLSYKVRVETEQVDGLGNSWREHSATGMRGVELVQEGAFFDDSTGNIHTALNPPGPSEPNGTLRVVVAGCAGNVIGQPFTGFQSAISGEYEVLGKVGSLQRANATYLVSGEAEDGVILHELSTETGDDDTEDESVYHGDEPQVAIPIVSSAAGSPLVVTTSIAHGLTSGDSVIIAGHMVAGSPPTSSDLNGEHDVIVLSPTTFSVADATEDGTGGTFVRGRTQLGGTAYLQMTALTLGGYDGALVTIRDSADDLTFADLVAFTARTAIGAQRVTVTGTVESYLAQDVEFTGSGSSPSTTYLAGFARN